MCGIFGVTSDRDIAPFVVDGLSNLEYRGYDSCGIATLGTDGVLDLRKGAGEVAKVRREERLEELSGKTALGHTRWATHGRVSAPNAHPHAGQSGDLAIVHNGILENYVVLKRKLEKLGYEFQSETDSEVVAHLIEEERKTTGSLREAILAALRQLEGTYGIGVISREEPSKLYGARLESPLILGIGEDFRCFASDPLAFSAHTRNAVILEDGELCVIQPDSYELCRIADGSPVDREAVELDLEVRDTEHAGFADYMSKEIFENAHVTQVALDIPESEIDAIAAAIEAAPTNYLTGIGTSYYVAVMAQYVFRSLSGRFVAALSSDELPYLGSFEAGEHVIAISQSGETFDTLKALRLCKAQGVTTSAILNVGSSSMAREVDRVVVQRAGAEICVLSTKSTVSQLVILFRVALCLGQRSGFLSADEVETYKAELDRLPRAFEKTWNTAHDTLRDLSRPLSMIRNWFFLGRGVYHGLALEAALKFKEVTYCHAEGLPAGALKHGTISLIDDSMHSAIFLPGAERAEIRTASLGAVAEIRARGGCVVAFQPEGAGDPDNQFYAAIEHPNNGPLTNPLLALMQAQLFAYYTARALGRNVDKPRNLAKSVTVG